MQVVRDARDARVLSDVRRTRAYQRSVAREASTLLGNRLDAGFTPWFGSRMATFYRAEIDRRPAVLKIVTGKLATTAGIQFDALTELAETAEAGGFRVPRPILCLPARAAMVMGSAEGALFQNQIPPLARTQAGIVELHEAASHCGRALAHIHAGWSSHPDRFGSAVANDIIGSSPWRSSNRDQQLLRAAGTAVDGGEVRSSRLYVDFDPCNVFVSGPRITLLDPPDIHLHGPVHWDVAAFRVGLERSMWRSVDRGRRRAVVSSLQETFTNSYAAGSRIAFGERDRLLTLLCEIARLAQLLAWWSQLTPREAAKGVARLSYGRPMVWTAVQSRRRALERLLG